MNTARTLARARAHNGYALWFFKELDETVEEAFLRLMKEGPLHLVLDGDRERAMLEGSLAGATLLFTDEDIALEAGKPWKDIERSVYAVMRKYGFKFMMSGKKKYLVKPSH